nr:hypothetical protein [Tanacetum cinerariifolium]
MKILLPEYFATASEEVFPLLIIEFGDSYKAPLEESGTCSKSESSAKKKGRTVAITTEDIQKRRNDTFGGNEATKKTKKNQLKQQYGNFKAEGSETLEQTFNRLHAIVSHLEFMDVEIERDDLNQKFLTSLAPKWLMYTIVWRNRNDLDTSSLQIDKDDIKEMDIKWNMALLSMKADRFWKKTGKKITIQCTDVAGFDKSKVECFNCHKMGHFARECRAPRSQNRGRRENYKQGSKVEESAPKALMAIDGVGWDWSYMDNEEENHALVADDEAPTEFALMAKSSSNFENEEVRDLIRTKRVLDTMLFPPPAQVYSPSKKDMSWTRLPEFADDTITDYSRPSSSIESNTSDLQNSNSSVSEHVESSESISSKPMIKFVKAADSPTDIKTNKVESVRKSFVRYAEMYRNTSKSPKGNSQNNIDDKVYWDSGFSRHMTDNISYLSDYEPYDGGYVAFGQGGGKITGKGIIKTGKLEFENVYFVKDLKYNLFSVSQICDNKNSVLFTDSECIVLGRDFKLKDDTNVLLRTPRKHNMYSIDLNNIVPHKDLTCLVAKASADESMLWHKRLVVTDDFSRFTWTFFLKTKDETSGILRNFITEIENLKELKVKIIRCDNGGEFKNREINEFCTKKGLKREFNNATTPQQNRIAERRNRTLIEAARTMVLVNKSHNKTSYELFNSITPAIGFLKPFGCHVMILNTLDHLGKFDAKGDEGYFIGYSMKKSEHNVDFHQIVDFVEASHIRYALTINLTVYVSHIRQFWSIARIETTNEGTKTLATVDEIPTLRKYSRRATRIAQSKALPTAADEPASLFRDDSQGEAFLTVSGLEAGHDRENIIKTSALPYDSTPRVTSLDADEGTQDLEISSLKARIKLLEDKNKGTTELSEDDAPIKGRSLEIGEKAGVEKSTERGSNDTEELVNVLTSMDTVNILTSGVQAISVPLVAEVSTVGVHTGSGLVPTVSAIFTTANVVTPYSRRPREISAKNKGSAKQATLQEATKEFYMSVLRSHSRWKTKHFRGMTLEEIKEKFIPVWKQIEDFVPMALKEEGERVKKKGLRLEQGSAKKIKTSKEVSEEDLKEMMQLVPVEEFDKEDLNQLWMLVKETLSIRQASSDKEKELWVKLKRLFEPDFEDQLDQEIFMLVERDYPLRRGLAIVMISNKLQEVLENDATLPRKQVGDGITSVLPITTGEEKTQRRLERNKADLDSMSMDDLYNNLKVYEPEVKGISSSNSNTQNIAFLSSTNSNTNGAVNTTQAVNTTNGVSTASTQVNTAFSTNIDNLSDAIICAFLATQLICPQLTHEDLEKIHRDDIEEMDLRLQMAMLTMRARRFLKKTRKKLTVNENKTHGFDISKVECYNCHKRGHFARECRAIRNQDFKYKESIRRTVSVESPASTALTMKKLMEDMLLLEETLKEEKSQEKVPLELNYVPWLSRLLRYAKSRPNGKLIHNSILNGPYVRRMIPEPGDAERDVNVNETFHEQTDDELSERELKQIEADDQAIQTILLGLPEDIYAAVDSCETAQEIWLRV